MSPLTRNVKSAPPAEAVLGDSDVMTGAGACTLKLNCPEAAVLGLITCAVHEDGSVPNVALTCICPLLMKVADFVVSTPNAAQRNRTVAPLTKPEPFTVKVVAVFAPVIGFGDTLLIVGLTALMVNVEPEDVPPPGPDEYTVTVAKPADAMSAAEICASKPVVNPPPLTTGVVVRFAPFHRTTDAWWYPCG